MTFGLEIGTEGQPVMLAFAARDLVPAVVRERTVRGGDVKEMLAILNVKISVYNYRILVLTHGFACLYISPSVPLRSANIKAICGEGWTQRSEGNSSMAID